LCGEFSSSGGSDVHTFKGKKACFNYNSDFSGEVIITVPLSHGLGSATIEVNGQDILDLVAEHIRLEKIGRLEQLSTEELLGVR
jgi:hypothetical protein